MSKIRRYECCNGSAKEVGGKKTFDLFNGRLVCDPYDVTVLERENKRIKDENEILHNRKSEYLDLYHGSCVEIDEFSLQVVTLQHEIKNLEAYVESNQARIDELMLEYCPDEMSEGQMAKWGRCQAPVEEVDNQP